MAPTPQLGGTGKDADGGKGRTQFEDDRRKGNQGGKDRPPIYKPQDDGQRGGYANRSKKVLVAKPGASNATKLAVKKITVDNGHHVYTATPLI